MNAEALKELFKPFGEVAVKRMFGGAGVYAEGLCFAIEQDGEVFLKADALSQPDFAAAGSSPFIYVARGKPMPTSFWRLPAIAHEEADELRPLGGPWRSRRRGARPKLRQSRKRESRPWGAAKGDSALFTCEETTPLCRRGWPRRSSARHTRSTQRRSPP